MKEVSLNDRNYEKLVNDVPHVGFDMSVTDRPSTNKRGYRIRRIADPHIRSKKIKGHVYYYYVRGVDKEIYLGDADAILKAVKGR